MPPTTTKYCNTQSHAVDVYCNIAILQYRRKDKHDLHAAEGTARTHRHHAHLVVCVAIWLVASACGCCFLEVASSILQQAPLNAVSGREWPPIEAAALAFGGAGRCGNHRGNGGSGGMRLLGVRRCGPRR